MRFMLMGAITLFVCSPLNGGAQAAEMESCQALSTTRFDAVVKQDETVQNGSDTSKKDKAKASTAASQPSGS